MIRHDLIQNVLIQNVLIQNVRDLYPFLYICIHKFIAPLHVVQQVPDILNQDILNQGILNQDILNQDILNQVMLNHDILWLYCSI